MRRPPPAFRSPPAARFICRPVRIKASNPDGLSVRANAIVRNEAKIIGSSAIGVSRLVKLVGRSLDLLNQHIRRDELADSETSITAANDLAVRQALELAGVE